MEQLQPIIDTVREIMDKVIGMIGPENVKYILIALGILVIIAIVKKAIKLGIFLIVAWIVISMLIMPAAQDFKEKYNFEIENNTAVVTIDSREYRIDKDIYKSIDIVPGEDGSYNIKLNTDTETHTIEVPKFIAKNIGKFAEGKGIEVNNIG